MSYILKILPSFICLIVLQCPSKSKPHASSYQPNNADLEHKDCERSPIWLGDSEQRSEEQSMTSTNNNADREIQQDWKIGPIR
jgi:hypothetical protein